MNPFFLLLLLLGLGPLTGHGAESLQGWLTSPGVTGDASAAPHRWDREIVYLSSLDNSSVPIAGMRMLAAEPGWFLIQPPEGLPAGSYALFTINLGNIDGGTVGFQHRAESVMITPGQDKVVRIPFEPEAHYVAMYNRHYEEWAQSPWPWGADFYQIFVATGDSVTRLATKLAGKDAGPGTHHLALVLNFAVYETNDGSSAHWKRISPIRTRFLAGTMDPIIHVLDVNYLSREITLIPGHRYAFRLWVGEGSECTRFAVVARPKNGAGYPGGQAYLGEDALDLDLYGYVSGGPPGTLNNFGPLDQNTPMNGQDLLGSRSRHGQSFRATGSGLAAVELLYTVGCAPNPSRRITAALHEGLVGPRIGPARICRTVTDVCQGRAAFFWSKGEAPLQPGRSYYLEFEGGEDGPFNVWSLHGDMPAAEAYVDGVSVGPKDLAVSIVEYK